MDFKYREYLAFSNPITAFLISLGLGIGMLTLFAFPPARWLFKKFATAAGQGPSDEFVFDGFPYLIFLCLTVVLFRALEGGFLRSTNITISTPSPTTGTQTVVKTVITGKGDPGYTLTAGMSLHLARDRS